MHGSRPPHPLFRSIRPHQFCCRFVEAAGPLCCAIITLVEVMVFLPSDPAFHYCSLATVARGHRCCPVLMLLPEGQVDSCRTTQAMRAQGLAGLGHLQHPTPNNNSSIKAAAAPLEPEQYTCQWSTSYLWRSLCRCFWHQQPHKNSWHVAQCLTSCSHSSCVGGHMISRLL